jgi:tRNA-Thr(GGU) m(6)t(6)A37 methyltransferase TsaA
MSVLGLFRPAALVGKRFWNRFVVAKLKRLLSWLWHVREQVWPSLTNTSSHTTKKGSRADKLDDKEKPQSFQMIAVGIVNSVYKEKFGTPRQGNLVPNGRGCIVLDKRAVDIVCSLDALQEFSHVWILFVFHTNTNITSKRTPSSKVRPPQGAGAKVGVFATRSPHRPNPIGLTMAKITRVDAGKGVLYLEGLDLCDGTPILDIKPYCENVDWPGSGVAVTPEWVTNPKFDKAPVSFAPEALQKLVQLVDVDGICEWYTKGESEIVRRTIEDILSLDPRDLSRGRGAFSVPNENADAVEVKETSFTRREEKIKDKAASRPVFTRFDTLDVTFRPSEDARGFTVTAVERFIDRDVSKRKKLLREAAS